MGNLVNPITERLNKSTHWSSVWVSYQKHNYSFLISSDYFLHYYINWYIKRDYFSYYIWKVFFSHYKILRFPNKILILFFFKDYEINIFLKEFWKLLKKSISVKNLKKTEKYLPKYSFSFFNKDKNIFIRLKYRILNLFSKLIYNTKLLNLEKYLNLNIIKIFKIKIILNIYISLVYFFFNFVFFIHYIIILIKDNYNIILICKNMNISLRENNNISNIIILLKYNYLLPFYIFFFNIYSKFYYMIFFFISIYKNNELYKNNNILFIFFNIIILFNNIYNFIYSYYFKGFLNYLNKNSVKFYLFLKILKNFKIKNFFYYIFSFYYNYLFFNKRKYSWSFIYNLNIFKYLNYNFYVLKNTKKFIKNNIIHIRIILFRMYVNKFIFLNLKQGLYLNFKYLFFRYSGNYLKNISLAIYFFDMINIRFLTSQVMLNFIIKYLKKGYNLNILIHPMMHLLRKSNKKKSIYKYRFLHYKKKKKKRYLRQYKYNIKKKILNFFNYTYNNYNYYQEESLWLYFLKKKFFFLNYINLSTEEKLTLNRFKNLKNNKSNNDFKFNKIFILFKSNIYLFSNFYKLVDFIYKRNKIKINKKIYKKGNKLINNKIKKKEVYYINIFNIYEYLYKKYKFFDNVYYLYFFNNNNINENKTFDMYILFLKLKSFSNNSNFNKILLLKNEKKIYIINKLNNNKNYLESKEFILNFKNLTSINYLFNNILFNLNLNKYKNYDFYIYLRKKNIYYSLLNNLLFFKFLPYKFNKFKNIYSGWKFGYFGRFQRHGRARRKWFSKPHGKLPLSSTIFYIDYNYNIVPLRNGLCCIKIYVIRERILRYIL